MEIISQANKVFAANFPQTAVFERAVFFSWSCAIKDCTFCYMSTVEAKSLKEARRSYESIFAETILCKKLGWDFGFLSGGIGVFSEEEILFMLKTINKILGKKIWLNIGPTPKVSLEKYKPYLKGIVGSIETVNPELHKEICPSKPTLPYEIMFKNAKDIGVECAMTLILGLGENINDFPLLCDFIKKNNISKIHIYSLVPQKGTVFENSPLPSAEYQAEWIARTRIAFPKLDIQCGIWEDRPERVSLLLKAGANSISKFPTIRKFNTEMAKEIEKQAQLAGREFLGTLTKMPEIGIDHEINKLDVEVELKQKIKAKLEQYINKMQHIKLCKVN